MKAAPVVSPYMTVEQLVEYLQLGSANAVYRLITEHRLPYGRVGRKYRFNKFHVDQWVEVRGTRDLAALAGKAS